VHKCSTYILACFGAQRAYRRYRYPESMPTKTGDNVLAWVLAAAVSGVGLVWLAIVGKKRKDHDA